MCLSADLGSSATQRLDWQGRQAEVRRDAWVVRAAGVDLPVVAPWRATSLGEGFFSLTAPGAGVQDVLGWAARTPAVACVEPDFAINPRLVSNDPSFGQLWGLNNTGQSGGVVDADIDAPEAWEVTTGSRSVVVAVIDTGVDYTHRDLAANAWRNPGEIPGDGIDNDRNGFVDDVFGWDFANNDANPLDDQGHGTHVAGTIGAVGNNGTGVVGVNWQVSIMALKFLGADGSGSTSGAIAAVNYATRMRRDFGINVVATNNSWGGGSDSTLLRDAIEAGGRAGILFVAAAGNDAQDIERTPSYPASFPSGFVISVAATDRSNRLSSFSNFGATSVDLAAPGTSITSTVRGNAYASYSGTSMATPHVTGAVALLAAARPEATPTELRSAILGTTTPLAALAGRTATGGLLNVDAAVRRVASVGAVDPITPLTADVVDVTPDPRTTAVDAITIAFNREVTGFDVADVRLARSGLVVSLAAASLTSADGGRTWTLSGLAAATASAGTYTLTVSAAGTGIADTSGRPLSASAADTWLTTAPAIGDVGDTIATAQAVSLDGGEVRLSGRIGDGSHGSRDVDFFAVSLVAGQTLVVDIDARSLAGGSTLDSFVRLFDASRRQLAANDDAGTALDSYLSFTARTAGTYYVGVSGYGNASYNPATIGSGRNGSTGVYQVALRSSVVSRALSAAAFHILGFRDGSAAALRSVPLFAIGSASALPAANGVPARKR